MSPPCRIVLHCHRERAQAPREGAIRAEHYAVQRDGGSGRGVRLPPIAHRRQPPRFHPPGVSELVNPREVAGKAKPYQVRRFLRLVERYNLHLLEAARAEGKPIPEARYRPVIYSGLLWHWPGRGEARAVSSLALANARYGECFAPTSPDSTNSPPRHDAHVLACHLRSDREVAAISREMTGRGCSGSHRTTPRGAERAAARTPDSGSESARCGAA